MLRIEDFLGQIERDARNYSAKVGGVHAASDLVQEAVLRFMEYAEAAYDETLSPPGAYVSMVTRQAFHAYSDRERAATGKLAPSPDEEILSLTYETNVGQHERAESDYVDLYSVINELDADDQSAILDYLAGYTYSEVAQATGVSPARAQRNRERARDRLLALIKNP